MWRGPFFVEEDGVAVEPRGGCDPRDGHGLKEELEGLVKAWGHIFQDHAGRGLRPGPLLCGSVYAGGPLA